VHLSPDIQDKTAFITRDWLWEWKVLLFGLTFASATFQRLVEQVLSGLHWKTLLIYVVVIVMSLNFDTHVSPLREVFDNLQAAGMKLKPSKCALQQQEVKYLGRIIG